MNVLVDFCGHSDLYYSFYLLFCKHLGYNLYYPLGNTWIKKGYLQQEYSHYVDGEFLKEEAKEGIVYSYMQMEPGKGFHIMKGISFEKFLEMDFEVILTSVYFNEKPFYELVKDHKPKAKFIRQIANIHERPEGFCTNILLGAAYYPQDYSYNQDPDKGLASVGAKQFMYFPEQYEGYKFSEPVNNKQIICLSKHISGQDLASWNMFKAELEPRGFTFQMYGDQFSPYIPDNKYGREIQHSLLPEAIRNAGFIWYTKPAGGGGYTVRQSLASGRPVILRRSYSSRHTSIECQLFKHGINCIDLDVIESNGKQGTDLLQLWADPANHSNVCKQVAAVFQADTKFKETAKKIGSWIDSLPRGIQ